MKTETILNETLTKQKSEKELAPIPKWVSDEIKATWRAARDAGGEMAAFRIIERMVDRLGYGRIKNNPSLTE